MNPELSNILESLDFSRLSFSILILILAFSSAKLLKVFSDRWARSAPDWRLRIEQVVTFCNFLLIIGSMAMAIFLLFRSKEAAIAIGGSLGLAFAFGAKDIAASVLSGLIVMFDRSFQVGDRIRFQDIYGDVISIGIRSTRIRTLDDSIVSIPNSQFMNSAVSSANSGALNMQVEIDFFIHPDSDLSLAETLAREAVVASRYTYLEKPIQILFKDVLIEQNFCTRMRIKAYVIETHFEKALESDTTKRIHIAFRKHKIESPKRN